jgi:hypothetical protein
MTLIRCLLTIATLEGVRETPNSCESRSAYGISIFWPWG